MMQKISLGRLSIALLLLVSCSRAPAPLETSISDATHACEGLFGLWGNFEDIESGADDFPAMLRQPPEEIANVKVWKVDSLDGASLSLANVKIPGNFGKIWVVEDLNKEDSLYEPMEAVELAKTLNEDYDIERNQNSEDIAVCIFRGLHSTQKCDYKSGISPLSYEIDSWHQLAYLFAIGLETNEISFLGIAKGEEAGCPYEIEADQRIVGPDVKAEQIVNTFDKLRESGHSMVEERAEKSVFLEVQYLDVFLNSSQRQYLLLFGTENAPEQFIPVLVENADIFRLFRLGLAGQDKFSSISIQEVEILDISNWKRNETKFATVYTLNTMAKIADLTGKAYKPVNESFVILQNGGQMQDFKLDVLSATGAMEFPVLFIEGKNE